MKNYTYNGITTTTPNLSGRFIKAVATSDLIGESTGLDVDVNNNITLKPENLPVHSHPHQSHTHTLTTITGVVEESEVLTTTINTVSNIKTDTSTVIETITPGEGTSITSTTKEVLSSMTPETEDVTVSLGKHTHNITISGGEVQSAESKEITQENVEVSSFNIEPNYYALLFIMKL